MFQAVVFAVACGALVIAQVIMGKATRDTLFLSSFQATMLPTAVIVTALCTIPAVLGGARLMTRVGPQRFLRALLLANAAIFSCEWLLQPVAPKLTAAVVYLQVGTFGGLIVSGFWSVVNERFDPHTARPVIAKISTGVTLGGLVGGIVAERLATNYGVRSLLGALAISDVLVLITTLGIGHGSLVQDPDAQEGSGLSTLARSDYLQRLALLVIVSAVGAATLDFSFKSVVATALADPARLAKFFAVYYMASSFATVLVQATASRYALQRFGIGFTLSVLPVALLVGGSTVIVLGTVTGIVALRAVEAVLSASFFRSAYEPLYTPLPPGEKRSTKAIVDVAADRLGDAIGSVCILVAIAATPNHSWRAAIAVALVAALGSLWLSRRMQTGYVSALASSLEHGMVRISEQDIQDATTRLTLSQTNTNIDRQQLLLEIGAMRKGTVAEPEFVRAVTELASGDPERVTRQLESGTFDKRLVAIVLPLLAFDGLRAVVARKLETVAGEVVGQLGDALLDQSLSKRARRRIPAILAQVHTTKAVRVLAYALTEPDFGFRQRCARALLSLRLHDPSLCPPNALVIAAIRRELDVELPVGRAQIPVQESEDQGLAQISGWTGSANLSHVFTLLSLLLPPDELSLALRALGSGDAKLRGTALEYLDNTLPPEIKPQLWPHIADSRPPAPTRRRSDRELTDELRRSYAG